MTYKMFEIENLPIELQAKIFSSLPVEDLESATLTCQHWRDVIHKMVFPKHIRLVIRPVHPVTHALNSILDILKFQLESSVVKCHLGITIVDASLLDAPEFEEYFQTYGKNIKSLNLKLCEVGSAFLKMFLNLNSLESLRVITESDMRFNMEGGMPLFPNLKRIYLYMENNFILKSIPTMTSTLVTLSLERFEVDLRDLKQIFEANHATLKNIIVKVDEMKPFFVLLNSFKDIKLIKLDITSSGCEDDYLNVLIETFMIQEDLRRLRFGSELPLRAVREIFKNLQKLEELDIVAETIPDCKGLAELKFLKKLTLSLYDVTPWDENVSITTVRFLNLSVTFPMSSPAIFKSFPNLKMLKLEDVDDESMRDIIVVQTLLDMVAPVKHLDLENFVFKEREILNDKVNRINHLENLRVLKYSCWDMSDASLFSFDIPELKELYLTRCPAINFKGINFLVEKCPLLDTLHIEYNKWGFTDDCVDLITRKLKKLKSLHLHDLRALTNLSLEFIVENCTRLRILTISNCTGITMSKADAIGCFSQIRSLKDLIFK